MLSPSRLAAALLMAATLSAHADPLRIYAAGSLSGEGVHRGARPPAAGGRSSGYAFSLSYTDVAHG